MPDDKFTIIFRRAPDYKIYPGSVIYGGPSPDLESIVMNVCIDHSAFPNYVQHRVVDGRADLSKVDDQVVMGNVERELLCGIVLTVDQATRMCAWLTQHIENIERLRNG